MKKYNDILNCELVSRIIRMQLDLTNKVVKYIFLYKFAVSEFPNTQGLFLNKKNYVIIIMDLRKWSEISFIFCLKVFRADFEYSK